jgi:hypothetical protein
MDDRATREERLRDMSGDYVGIDVHCAARICSAAHGGQAVVSEATKSRPSSVRTLPRRAVGRRPEPRGGQAPVARARDPDFALHEAGWLLADALVRGVPMSDRTPHPDAASTESGMETFSTEQSRKREWR